MLATAAAIFSVLLIVTGAAKVARPNDVTKALTDLGTPRLPGAGLLIGFIEIAVGCAALISPTMLMLQGILYLAFAAWVLLALRSDAPIASCGCLGRSDTPPTVAHIELNVLAALLSFGAVNGRGLVFVARVDGLTQIVVISVGVFLAYLVLNQAAQLVGARRT